jgi:hypothetical protein
VTTQGWHHQHHPSAHPAVCDGRQQRLTRAGSGREGSAASAGFAQPACLLLPVLLLQLLLLSLRPPLSPACTQAQKGSGPHPARKQAAWDLTHWPSCPRYLLTSKLLPGPALLLLCCLHRQL